MNNNSTSTVFTQYMNTVLENIQDAVMLIDVEPNRIFRLLLSNNAFCKESGYPEDSVGKTVDKVVPAKNYAALVQKYDQVISTRAKVSYVEWFDVPLGRRAYEVTLHPIFNAVGDCSQILAITRNVTELLELRQAMAEVRAIVSSNNDNQ